MILVVGGAGYIGSHMLLRLREAGEAHLAFDNLEKGHRTAVVDSPLFVGDLRNPEDLERVFVENPDIDTVMHFAAYIEVGESVKEPVRYWRNNVSAVLDLLDAMRRHGIKRFVFSSTCATFGEPERLPLDEDHPQRPVSPYGDTKLAVEKILDAEGRANGLKSVILRYFNASGADPEGRIGEAHDPETHLVPNAIRAALGLGAGLKVFGTDYDTVDGTCLRDYIHVLDLADAHLLAVRRLRADGDSGKFNLGNGQGYTVRQVIDAVAAVSGREVPFETGPRRPGDAAKLVGDSTRARRDLGWSPKYPDLEDIVRHAWQWHSEHPHGYGRVSTG
ncbi:UDP-glucose 4-epimerase GalE [bacterium]|nr:MAG: UDP-glucose 4-epimerase GalE [bacterium]